MLFIETIREWKDLEAPSATSVLLNSNRIGLLEADGSNSKYYYTLNPRDRRDKAGFIKGTLTVAALLVVIDDVLSSKAMKLPVFNNDDTSVAAVTKYIDYEDFAYAVAHETSPTAYSWVYYYSKGFKKHRVLVDYNLNQLEDIAQTGATT